MKANILIERPILIFPYVRLTNLDSISTDLFTIFYYTEEVAKELQIIPDNIQPFLNSLYKHIIDVNNNHLLGFTVILFKEGLSYSDCIVLSRKIKIILTVASVSQDVNILSDNTNFSYILSTRFGKLFKSDKDYFMYGILNGNVDIYLNTEQNLSIERTLQSDVFVEAGNHDILLNNINNCTFEERYWNGLDKYIEALSPKLNIQNRIVLISSAIESFIGTKVNSDSFGMYFYAKFEENELIKESAKKFYEVRSEIIHGGKVLDRIDSYTEKLPENAKSLYWKPSKGKNGTFVTFSEVGKNLFNLVFKDKIVEYPKYDIEIYHKLLNTNELLLKQINKLVNDYKDLTLDIFQNEMSLFKDNDTTANLKQFQRLFLIIADYIYFYDEAKSDNPNLLKLIKSYIDNEKIREVKLENNTKDEFNKINRLYELMNDREKMLINNTYYYPTADSIYVSQFMYVLINLMIWLPHRN